MTQEEIFWGLSCAGSRTFTADFGEGPAAEAMCPIADMVLELSVGLFNYQLGSFAIIAMCPIADMVLERAT